MSAPMTARTAVDVLGLDCFRSDLINIAFARRVFRFHLATDEKRELVAAQWALENVAAFRREQSRRRDALHHAARQARERRAFAVAPC